MEQVAMGKVPRGEEQWAREGRNRQKVTEERWPWRLHSARLALTSHTCAGGVQNEDMGSLIVLLYCVLAAMLRIHSH